MQFTVMRVAEFGLCQLLGTQSGMALSSDLVSMKMKSVYVCNLHSKACNIFME